MEKLYNKNIGFIYGIAPYEDGEPYDPFEYLMPDKLTVSTDKIAYHNICLELLKELFEELPKKDREILGHSYALFGYKRKDLDKLCLENMMTADGIIKARRAAIKKMQEYYPNSKLRLWKKVYLMVMRVAEHRRG